MEGDEKSGIGCWGLGKRGSAGNEDDGLDETQSGDDDCPVNCPLSCDGDNGLPVDVLVDGLLNNRSPPRLVVVVSDRSSCSPTLSVVVSTLSIVVIEVDVVVT